MRFYDYTLIAGGTLSRREHESSSLGRGAVEVFRDMLEKHENSFRAPVPMANRYILMLSSENTGVALATFLYREIPITTSVLLSGKNSRDEAKAIEETQKMIVRMFQNTGMEPGWDLREIQERPVIVSLILPSAMAAGREAVGMVADMETCLAAAYFEMIESE